MGLGKGVILIVVVVNWVFRDGIGYLSKIVFFKYGWYFDVYFKGWRFVFDLIENMLYGLELLIFVFFYFFVYLVVVVGVGCFVFGFI